MDYFVFNASCSGIKTFFAPSDAAFAKLDPDYLEGLTSQQKLGPLKYHDHTGNYPVINEIKREAIGSLQGDLLFVEIGQSILTDFVMISDQKAASSSLS